MLAAGLVFLPAYKGNSFFFVKRAVRLKRKNGTDERPGLPGAAKSAGLGKELAKTLFIL